MEDHINAVLPYLRERNEDCDAMVCCMSSGEVMKLTRMGRFSMSAPQSGPLALIKKLRGKGKNKNKTPGAQQLAVLRKLPSILRYIPGTAQDLRAYFLTLQYWLAGSDENIERMVRFLVNRYAEGPRQSLRGSIKAKAPIEYPEVGLYHPKIKNRITVDFKSLPTVKKSRGTVGLLIMRSYVLAGNTAHYDEVIRSLEARNLNVVAAFSSGLDARPAADEFFIKNKKPLIDALISLTGFSLVGGPAYNDSKAAQDMLAELDVPYVAAQPLEFQTIDQWENSEQGLIPLEATMMVAIPELDGATGSIIYGGRNQSKDDSRFDTHPHHERVQMLTSRVEKLISLRNKKRKQKKIGIVLFNFPPNAGNTGTAAHLSVFASLFNTLKSLKKEGYEVDVPKDVDALRKSLIEGNASKYGSDANVHTVISADDHVQRETYLAEIEEQWGAAPGKQLSNGSSIFVLGEQFGNVFVGIQPGFGYEGDPMRLLFEKGFAPTHAFSAFYRYLREDFMADAVLHFGTHGALEFMPGKQVGLSQACWPDRLIQDLPNFYLYAANNPSEGTIAKRRAAATLISYLTPPVAKADLYKGLVELKGSMERWRTQMTESSIETKNELAALILAQAAELDLVDATLQWNAGSVNEIEELRKRLHEYEETLIPYGLHVVGETLSNEERIDVLTALANSKNMGTFSGKVIEKLIAGKDKEKTLASGDLKIDDESLKLCEEIITSNTLLKEDHELSGIINALDARFIRPAPGGDLIRNSETLPSGRNLHGFDPFRLPSVFAVMDGARQAEKIIEKHTEEGNSFPESIALVLWGTDNLKTEGGAIAQALALIGAKPRLDSYGRVVGAELISLEELGRPRVDVIMTLSGIFRDLLPYQTKLLAEAAFLAATADESEELNFVRKHSLEYQLKNNCDIETAALRVFSNAEGAYGSNVNMMIDNGRWDDEDDLAETYSKRKCYAYGCNGKASRHEELLDDMLADVHLAYQNLDSVDLGVTTIDHYYDTLGGITRAAKRSGGEDIPVYISDQTSNTGKVRTLTEQVALETRTRTLNPKWYESMLSHGYEGVSQIENHVTNTMAWSATTGQVEPWVYKRLTQTFILDKDMRERLAELNPTASVKVANRLLEAHERQYWKPDDETLSALRDAGEDLEDRLEGIINQGVAA
jgi:magnesium chelatase subunit H